MYKKIKQFIKKYPLLYGAALRMKPYMELPKDNKAVYNNIVGDKSLATGRKGVIYTCITGGYDTLHEPVSCPEDIDYIAYIDTPLEHYRGKWQIRTIPVEITDTFRDNTLINRYVKLHPAELFCGTYDYAVYIDGNFTVLNDLRGYYSIVKKSETGIAIHRHYRRKDIYEEKERLLESGKGDKAKICRFIENCEAEGMPHGSGLYEACVIATDLGNSKAKELLDKWFDMLVESGCGRDQIVLPYLLWKEKIRQDAITSLGSNVYENPLFRKDHHSI